MKQLQKQLSKAGKSGHRNDGQEAGPLPSSGAMRQNQKAMQVSAQRNQPSEFLETPQMMAAPAAVVQVPVNREPSSEVEQQKMSIKSVSVKPGDTLWRIAQKYGVNVEYLRKLNQLTDNTIVVGQVLWVPVDPSMSEVGAEKVVSTP
jgi:LysM repeat protein